MGGGGRATGVHRAGGARPRPGATWVGGVRCPGTGPGSGAGIRTGRACGTALEGQDPGCGGLAWGWPRGA